MELTDAIKKLERMIGQPDSYTFTVRYYRDELKMVLESLQAERAKPKDDLWKDAPVWAVESYRIWKSSDGRMNTGIISIRELPKTRADELAEECAREIGNMVCGDTWESRASGSIKSAILKAQAEWEAGR